MQLSTNKLLATLTKNTKDDTKYTYPKISLITNAEVIYEGILYAIRCDEKLIFLKDVYQIDSNGVSLTSHSIPFELFKASEIHCIYLHHNNEICNITDDVLRTIDEYYEEIEEYPQYPQYADVDDLNLDDQYHQVLTTFSASTVDMTEFDEECKYNMRDEWALEDDVDVDVDVDVGVNVDVDVDDVHIDTHIDDIVDSLDCLMELDPFDGLDDVLGLEYIKSKPTRTDAIDEATSMDEATSTYSTYFGFDSSYVVSSEEVLIHLSGYKFHGGSRLNITEKTSETEITYTGDTGDTITEEQLQPMRMPIAMPMHIRYQEYHSLSGAALEEWNTCYGSFFIRSAHKNKIWMKINRIELQYGICVGIVDGDKDNLHSFHFGDLECNSYAFRSDGVQYMNGKLVGKWDEYKSGDELALLIHNNSIQWRLNSVIKCVQYNIVASRKYRLAISICGRNNSVSIVNASKIENAQSVLKKKKKNKKKKKKQKRKKKKKKKKLMHAHAQLNDLDDSIANECIHLSKKSKYSLGDCVRLRNGNVGVIKLSSKTCFSNNQTLYGIQLCEWNPNGHNGSYDGTSYFVTVVGHGFFAKADFIADSVSVSVSADVNININGYTLSDIHFGNRVLLTNGLSGSIRFMGKLHFDDTVWIGIDLKKQNCNGNDGCVLGKQYFSPKPKCGYFIKMNEIERVLPNKSIKKKRKKQKKKRKCLKNFPKLGDRVKTINGRIGVVEFIGVICLVKDICIGLSLDRTWPYCNDGTIKNTQYFHCDHGRGYFVRLQHLIENLGCTHGKNGQQMALEDGKTVNVNTHIDDKKEPQQIQRQIQFESPVLQQQYYKAIEKIKEIEMLEDRRNCGFFLFPTQFKKIEKKEQYLNMLNDIKNGTWVPPNADDDL